MSNLALTPSEYRFHQYLATYPVYEAVNGVDLFLHLDMFAQHCEAGHPLVVKTLLAGHQDFTAANVFKLQRGNIYFLFMAGEGNLGHLYAGTFSIN